MNIFCVLGSRHRRSLPRQHSFAAALSRLWLNKPIQVCPSFDDLSQHQFHAYSGTLNLLSEPSRPYASHATAVFCCCWRNTSCSNDDIHRRKTNETAITVDICLDGTGKAEVYRDNDNDHHLLRNSRASIRIRSTVRMQSRLHDAGLSFGRQNGGHGSSLAVESQYRTR